MPVIFSADYGVVVVDRNKNILWEWPGEKMRVYGLSVDPLTGNIYIAGMIGEIYEVTKAGSVVWRYRHPKLKDPHSLTLTPERNILIASTVADRVLEINKKKGIVWEWWVGDHFDLPKGEYRDYRMYFERDIDWTHLNYAERLPDGDTLISLFRRPDTDFSMKKGFRERGRGLILRVNKNGDIVHRWGEEIVLREPHVITPYRKGFLIADTLNKRLLYAEDKIKSEINVGHTFNSIEVQPNGDLLLGVTSWGNSGASHGLVLEITPQGKEVWRYEPVKGKHVFVAHSLPKWDVKYTEEEKRALTKKLKTLGYID